MVKLTIPASRCRRRTSTSCTAPTARARPTSGRLPGEGLARVSQDRRRRRHRSNGRSASAARAAKASRRWSRRRRASIGYVELIYALQNKIPFGAVQNSAGKFVRASIDGDDGGGRCRGGQDARGLPRVDHESSWRQDVYPIASFTWLLLYENPQGQGAGEDHGRFPEVGADRRAEVRLGRSATRRCPRTSSTWN